LALFLPLTFSLHDAPALIFLVSLYYSTVYGGAISAILLNVPGTPGSVATCFDGHPLARQGKAGLAISSVTFATVISGIIGALGLIFTAPFLAKFALMLGPSEYFMLALLGLSLVAMASKGDTLRGLAMGGFGLLLAFVGRDMVSGTLRFTFGSMDLESGISFVPVSIGVFAIAQALTMAEEGEMISQTMSKVTGGMLEGLKAVIRNILTVIRSSVIGLLIGIMPGIGISISNFIAYLIEQRFAKDPETFGTGNIRGLLAPESANKATVAGELVPAFSLGIPGGATSALFLIAMTVHGIRPGADLFSSNATLMSTVYWSLLLASFPMLLVGLLGAKYMAKVTRVPNSILVPIIIILSVLGALAFQNSMNDVIIAVVFGIIGYVLIVRKYPVACLVLGMVLGPLAESNFQRAMLLSDNSYSIFVTRPLSLLFFIIIILSLVVPPVLNKFGKKLDFAQMTKGKK
jgi:putative tricarboxylic transport membrane protein